MPEQKPKKVGGPKMAKGRGQGKNRPCSVQRRRPQESYRSSQSQQPDTIRLDTEHIECRNPRMKKSN